MSRNILVRDVMTKNVITLNSEMSLEQAWNTFYEHKITGAPVVESSGTLVGILSQTDLAREAFEKHLKGFQESALHSMTSYFQTLEERPLPDFFKRVKVGDIMDQDVVTASINDSIPEVATKMRQNHIHRIVIVDKEKVVGIVSALDLLNLLT